MLTTKKLRSIQDRVSIASIAKEAGLSPDVIQSAIRPDTPSRKSRELSEIEAVWLTLELQRLAADIRKAIK